MANKPGEANFFPDVPVYPEMGTFQPVYGKFDLTTYIQGASDYEIMAFLVGKYNACLEAYGTVTKLSTDTVTACKQLQDWINSWFDNLDVQEELNKKIDSMVQDGSFDTLLHQTFDEQINQQTTNAVTQWLVANVTPTGSAVVVDKSLSIEGAAADAKYTGIACSYKRQTINWNSNNVTLTNNATTNSYFGYSNIIPKNSVINSIQLTDRTLAGTLSIFIVDENLKILKTVKITSDGSANQTFNIDYVTTEKCSIIIGTETGAFRYSPTGGTGNFIEYNKDNNKFTPIITLNTFACGVVISFTSNSIQNNLDILNNLLFTTEINWNSNNVTLTNNATTNSYFGYSNIIPKNSVINSIQLTDRTLAGTLSIFIVDENLKILKTVKITSDGSANQTFNIDYVTTEKCSIIIGTETGAFRYSPTGGTGNFIEYNKDNNKFTPIITLNTFACGVVINGLFNDAFSDISYNNIIVSKTGNITKISEGVAQAKKNYLTFGIPQTVTVLPGTYEEYIIMNSSDGISIVGTDRNQCIIIDNSGDYRRAPIRVSGNAYIANLTLIATHKNAKNYVTNGNLNVNPSYALHIDDRHPDDNKNYRCTIENCILISQQNPAVGIGLDKNQIIELINCECIRDQTDDLDNIASISSNVFAWKPNGGAVFYHAQYPHYTDDSGSQTLRVKNCIIKNNRNNTIAGEAGSSLDSNVVLELIGNSGYALNGLAWDKNLSSAVISPLSNGNNISSMNYTE